ncbi:MAG TPA: YceI family protein [Gemmatimonadaceae bacterium]|jgi:polyisoprenoid-binding protein YceI|nr:YceI family protein [Gemmatimonadaceae bacterium]
MTTAIQPITGTTTWALDPAHSHVEFAVKHLMISNVKGRFGEMTGTLKGNLDEPERFNLDVSITTDSIDTRQAQRDAHLRSADFFDAERWPTIRFVGKRIDGDVNGEFSLIGELSIRDVTREVKLDVTNEGAVTDPWGNSRIGFSAQGKIDRREFGLTWNQALEAGGFVVGDEIKISIDAEFTAQAEEAKEAA